MDLSDGENDDTITTNRDKSRLTSEMSLRDENDVLLCQVESLRNEAVFVQEESRQERQHLEKQIAILQQALQGMQHQLIALTRQNTLQPKQMQITSDSHNRKEVTEEATGGHISADIRALLISLISIYFSVHPYGTTSEDICAYLSQQSHIRDTHLLSTTFIDAFLAQYSQLFTQLESHSNGRKLWRFCAFQR